MGRLIGLAQRPVQTAWILYCVAILSFVCLPLATKKAYIDEKGILLGLTALSHK
jgi:hypothetical protein